MPLLNQIIARVVADTGQAKQDIADVTLAMAGVGQAAVGASPSVDALTGQILAQQQQAAALGQQLDQTVIQYGAASQQAGQLRLAIDQLSTSIQTNEQRLAVVLQGLGAWTQAWAAAAGQSAGAAQGLTQVGQGVQSVGTLAQTAAAPVDALTQRIDLQQRQLALLQNQLAAATKAHGTNSEEVQRAQLAVDRLSVSLQANQQQLATASQFASQAAAAQQALVVQTIASAERQIALGEAAQSADPKVAALAEKLGHQYRQLDLLQQGLVETIGKYGQGSRQAEAAQLAIDKLSASIQANEQALEQAGRKTIDWGQAWIGAQRSIGELGVQAVQRLTQGLIEVGGAAVQSYASNERLGQSLQSLVAQEQLQSGAAHTMAEALAQASGKAQGLLAWNQQLAVNSPFSQEGVAQAFRQAQAFGFVSDSANATDVTAKRLTQTLIDYAAAAGRDEETMQRITVALGQMQAKGKATGDEIFQLSEAGLPVRQILAEALGVSTAKAIELQEKGLIPANVAIRAIVENLEANFGGAAARSANSVAGLLNSLDDLQQVSLRNLFAGAIEAAQPLLQDLVATLSAPETQQAITEFGRNFGNGLRVVLPELVSGVRAFAGVVAQGYETAKPLFDFLEQNAVPMVGTLTGALAGYAAVQAYQAIPATLSMTQVVAAQIPILKEQALAMLAAAGPIAVVVAAVAGAGLIIAKVSDDINKQSEAVAHNSETWKASKGVLDEYSRASEVVQQRLSEEAQALDQANQIQDDNIKRLGQKLVAIRLLDDAIKNQTGIETGWYDRAYQEGVAALNANQQAIRDRTGALREHIQEQERLVEAAKAEDAAMFQQIPNAKSLADAQKEAAAASAEQAQQLQKLADQGAQAFGKLIQSGDAYREQEAQRAAAHSQKIADAQAQAAEKLASLDEQTNQKRADQLQSYNENVAKLRQDHDQQQLRNQEAFQEQVAQRAEAHQQKLGDLAKRGGELLQTYERQRSEAAETAERARADQAQRYADQVTSIQERAASQQAQQAQRYADQEEQAARSHQQKLLDLAQQAADLQEQAAREAADRVQSYQDKLTDLQARAAEKLSGLQEQASDRARDREQSYQDDQQRRGEDHQDKLADLQKRLEEAKTDVQRQAAQAAIDAENERFAREEARAAEKLQRETQRAQEQLQREQARIQEQLQREEQEAAQQRQREEQEAQEKLAREQAKLAREKQQQEAAFAEKQAQAQQRYERERAQQAAALADQLEQAQLSYERQLAQLADKHQREQVQAQRKLADDQARLAEQVAAEQASFQKAEAQARQHYDRQRAEQDAKLAEQLTSAQQSHARQEAELSRHYNQERAQQAAALADRLAAEQRAYAEQERQQALQYAKREQQEQEALGKSLISYVNKQKDLGKLDGDQAEALTELLRQKYGVRQSIEERAFAASVQAINDYAAKGRGSMGDLGRALDLTTQAALSQSAAFDQQLKTSVDQVAQRFLDKKIGPEQFAQALRAIPTQIDTQINATVTVRGGEALQRFLDFKDGQGVDGPPRRAQGGSVSAGDLYRVNEDRTEFFRPNVGGTIIPLAPAGAGGATTIIYVNIVLPSGLGLGSDVRATALAIRDELIRIGRENNGNLFAGQA